MKDRNTTPGMRIEYGPAAGGGNDGEVYADDAVCLTAELPRDYPFESVLENGVIGIEGLAYGTADLRNRIERWRAEAPDDDAGFARGLQSAAAEIDGDFVIAAYNQHNQRLCIAGDSLGRLPLYYTFTPDGVVVARDQRFVLDRRSDTGVDRTALAQLLLLGYPLGNRTLAENIHRLLPGESIVASPAGARVVPAARSPFAVDRTRPIPDDLHECAAMLRDAFVTACRARASAGRRHVLSLSGGMDSRAVGAAMRSVLDTYSAVTFVAPDSAHADERGGAERVAQAIGADWKAWTLDAHSPRCAGEIIDLKLGLSPADLAFGLDYVRRVREEFGSGVAFWTGEGGDKLFCDHRSIPHGADDEALVRFIIDKNAVWSLRDATALTGVHPDDVRESIRASVAAVGERDREDRYVHWLLRERVVRWHFEGEDRHRTCVWPVSPFYARDVRTMARAIPARRKTGRRLYRAFLSALGSDVGRIPLPDGSPAPASLRYAIGHALRDRARYNRAALALHRRLRRARGPIDRAWLARLAEIADRCPPAVDSEAVRHVLRHPSRRASALPLLWTAIAAADTISPRPGKRAVS